MEWPQPIADRVLVRRKARETVYGSLVLPDNMKFDPLLPHGVFAEVLAVGPGRLLECGEREPVGAAVGDTVVIHGYISGAGQEFEWQGEKLLMVKSDLCLAVVES